MKFASLHSGHDMNISLFEDGRCIYHLEFERLFDIKHYGNTTTPGGGTHFYHNMTPTLIDHALPAVGWKFRDLDALAVDTIGWMFALYPDEDFRRAFGAFDHHYDTLRRPASHGTITWRNHTLEACAVMHHLSHLAGAYYTSPFDDALLFAYDGLGEFDMNTAWGIGTKNKIKYRGDFMHRLPHGLDRNSIGFIYTYMGGILHFMYTPSGDAAGKAMGLSAYGKPRDEFRQACRNKIRGYVRQWSDLIGIVKDIGLTDEDREDSKSQVAWDFMATLQDEAEIYMLETIGALVKRTGRRNLCLAGGCALNVQINQRLLDEKVIDAIHIPPACSDCGNAIGSGLYYWHHVLDNPFVPQKWHTPYLGDEVIGRDNLPEDPDVENQKFSVPEMLYAHVAEKLAEGKIVGWAQGRAEIGPRALGNRSILADPRSPTMKDDINAKVKHRDYWRPFAPVCLAEHAQEWFDTDIEHPYMLMAPQVRPEKRELIPAVTHVDGTGRLQTVTKDQNPKLYLLLKQFYKRTGVPILLNTSLNDRAKPIANHAHVIVDLVKDTGMDMAVIGPTVYTKRPKIEA